MWIMALPTGAHPSGILGNANTLRIVEIQFDGGNRANLVVEMPNPDRYTTRDAPHIPRFLFRLFPHLARHRCDNGNGYSFRRECHSTEIPHLLEHLIIELQGQAQKSGLLKGETQWDWRIDPKGRFHVQVEYENELLVLGAIRVAERIINALDSHEFDEMDIQSDVENLKRLARLGYEMGRLSDHQLAQGEAERFAPAN